MRIVKNKFFKIVISLILLLSLANCEEIFQDNRFFLVGLGENLGANLEASLNEVYDNYAKETNDALSKKALFNLIDKFKISPQYKPEQVVELLFEFDDKTLAGNQDGYLSRSECKRALSLVETVDKEFADKEFFTEEEILAKIKVEKTEGLSEALIVEQYLRFEAKILFGEPNRLISKTEWLMINVCQRKVEYYLNFYDKNLDQRLSFEELDKLVAEVCASFYDKKIIDLIKYFDNTIAGGNEDGTISQAELFNLLSFAYLVKSIIKEGEKQLEKLNPEQQKRWRDAKVINYTPIWQNIHKLKMASIFCSLGDKIERCSSEIIFEGINKLGKHRTIDLIKDMDGYDSCTIKGAVILMGVVCITYNTYTLIDENNDRILTIEELEKFSKARGKFELKGDILKMIDNEIDGLSPFKFAFYLLRHIGSLD